MSANSWDNLSPEERAKAQEQADKLIGDFLEDANKRAESRYNPLRQHRALDFPLGQPAGDGSNRGR